MTEGLNRPKSTKRSRRKLCKKHLYLKSERTKHCVCVCVCVPICVLTLRHSDSTSSFKAALKTQPV